MKKFLVLSLLTISGVLSAQTIITGNGLIIGSSSTSACLVTPCPIVQGGTGAITAAGAATNITSGQALTPASVIASGALSGLSVTDTGFITSGIVTNTLGGLFGTISIIPAINGGSGEAGTITGILLETYLNNIDK